MGRSAARGRTELGADVVDGEPGSAVQAAPHGPALAQRNGGCGGDVGRERLGLEHRSETVVGNVELRSPTWVEGAVEGFRNLVWVAQPQRADADGIGDRLPRMCGQAQLPDKVIPPDRADWLAGFEVAEQIATAR